MELSTEIKEARRKLGLSQSQAAKAWGVPLRTLQAWEQKTNSPKGFALKHLRALLDGAVPTRIPTPESTKSNSKPNSTQPPSARRRKPTKDRG